MNEDKEKMLKLTTDQIESKFGKGSIMTLGEGGADLNIGVIPTGALPLDAALGIGGVPRGRIIEIYGPESSGKTTLALQILAEAQALGGIVAFFVYHCSRNVLWSTFFYLTFYFFCNAMNGMRQAVAMALCLVAFTVVLKWRKWLVALLLSIMAAGVHVTCLIFAPFVFAPLLRLTKETFARLSVAIVVVIVVGSVSIKLLLALFSTLFPGYYGQYIDILLGDAFAASGKNLIQTAFYAVLLFAFYWMCVRERHDREARALFLPVLCGLALSTVFFQNYLLGARIPLYCTVVLIAIVPNMLERLGKTKMAVASGLVFVSLSLLFILLSGNYAGVVPYEMVV